MAESFWSAALVSKPPLAGMVSLVSIAVFGRPLPIKSDPTDFAFFLSHGRQLGCPLYYYGSLRA